MWYTLFKNLVIHPEDSGQFKFPNYFYFELSICGEGGCERTGTIFFSLFRTSGCLKLILRILSPHTPLKGKKGLPPSANSLALPEALKWLPWQTLKMGPLTHTQLITPIPLGIVSLPGTWPLKGHSPISQQPGSESILNLSAGFSEKNANS